MSCTANFTAISVETVEQFFTAPQVFNIWPQASLHTQWPGTGLKGDPVFDFFYSTQVQSQSNNTLAEENNRHAYAALLDRVGPAIIVSHSQAGPYGWQAADARPQLVKGILAIEPNGPPFVNEILNHGFERSFGITDTPVAYDPPAGPNGTDLRTMTVAAQGVNESSCILQMEPAKKLVNLSKMPILVTTSQASYHAVYDRCTVDYLRQAGVNATWLHLPEIGIYGNGHLMFMEKNNIEIAEVVNEWLIGI
ncbi:hypothetical protein M8818_000874 [Zalaria obscura]|uniref:Uncharacterized protein n=1 Tax=Zalaria obscura TaxID=2024903 RepID=A0ACC3SN14_9PEZI